MISSEHRTRIGRIELWWRKGVWLHPDEYVFSFDKDTCHDKCIIVEAGCFGFTWLRGDCIRPLDKINEDVIEEEST